MKKLRITLLTALFTYSTSVFAQSVNVFPPTGKVGIGTATPKESLHIADGTIIIDDLADIPPTPFDPIIKRYSIAVFDETGKLQKATEEILGDIGIVIPGPEAGGLYWRLHGNDTVLSFHYLGTNYFDDLRIEQIQ